MSGSETISSTGRARAASDLTAERARTAATVGDHAGRTVRAGSIRAASLGRSVRSQSIGTVPAGVRQATAPGIGPDAGHIYESLDAASDERRGTPTVRPAATSSARGPEYSALHPPQLPARPAGGFLRRAVQPDTAPPGQLGISVRAGRQAPSANEAGARLVQTAASNPGPGRLGEYETPMPSSDSGLERFSGYLVNMLEEGRIPRSMQGDLESALLFAGRLDSDLARGVQLSGGSAAGQPPAGEERLSSVTARNAGEVGRTLTLLDGCLARNDATPEARALIRGLRARIAERHSALVELVLRNAETARPSRPSVEAGTRSAGNRAHTGGPLAGFVGGAARSRRADAQLTVAADGQVAVRKGLFSQWRGQRQTEANRATASSFLAALRETYGKEVADIAGSSDGVQRALTRGRALQAKDVDAAVQRANTLATQYRAETDRLATMYVTPEESSGVSLTKIKIDDVARRLPAGHGPRGTAALVDAHAVGERVAAAIRSKGDGGKHLVTTEEARGILDTVVRDELMGAYNAARIEVMAQLSPEDPESLLRRSLETAVAERGLALQPERLGSGACDVLQRRADAAVRSLDAGAVGDQAETQRIADELAADFAAERAEAEAALDESGLSGPTRSATTRPPRRSCPNWRQRTSPSRRMSASLASPWMPRNWRPFSST